MLLYLTESYDKMPVILIRLVKLERVTFQYIFYVCYINLTCDSSLYRYDDGLPLWWCCWSSSYPCWLYSPSVTDTKCMKSVMCKKEKKNLTCCHQNISNLSVIMGIEYLYHYGVTMKKHCPLVVIQRHNGLGWKLSSFLSNKSWFMFISSCCSI